MIEYLIEGTLHLETALHTGAGNGGNTIDNRLRRTRDGRLVLTGRTLGGSLREAATRIAPGLGLQPCVALTHTPQQLRRRDTACGCHVCMLFGDVNPSEHSTVQAGGVASRLWIADAHPEAPAESNGDKTPQTHVRDGVGISRQTGTAAKNVKFTQELLPAGSAVFPIRLRVEAHSEDEAGVHAIILAAVLEMWKDGYGRLGGNIARGLGRVKLKEVKCRRRHVEDADSLISFLKDDGGYVEDPEWLEAGLKAAREAVEQRSPKAPTSEDKSAKHTPVGDLQASVTIAFKLSFASSFLVNDPLVALLSGFDHAPHLTVAVGQRGLPILPGSALRGVLRKQAEKIARTLATHQALQTAGAEAATARDIFLRHCPACDPLVRDMAAPLVNCDSRSQIGQREETTEGDLCLACGLFGSPRRRSRLWVDDATWANATFDADDWMVQDFLAIDRFTGGGKDGAKFDAAPLVQAGFNVQIHLQNPKAWELGWLVLVLRDLADGLVRVGFGGAKGYGAPSAEEFDYTFRYLEASALPGGGAWLPEQGVRRQGVFYEAQLEAEALRVQQEQWVAAFVQQVVGYEQPARLSPPQRDTFFTETNTLVDLYGGPYTPEEGTDGA